MARAAALPPTCATASFEKKLGKKNEIMARMAFCRLLAPPLLFTEKEARQEKRNNGAYGVLPPEKLGKKNEIMPCAPASRATYGTASFEKKLGKKSEKEQALDHGRKSQV